MTSLFKISDNNLECLLCPHYCKLTKGKTGICGARKNTGEIIDLMTYGVISGFALDPVEKKPLYHFFPGYSILSAGSFGCNMRCDFCQNYSISQKIPENIKAEMTPEKIVKTALSAERNIGVAFTYNEPVIWFEFMRDVATIAKAEGLFTVMVSNGYVNKEPLDEIIQFIDAFNIDLKAFNGDFYKKLTGVDIEPVRRSLKQISKSGKHLEITTLIIPGQNDNEMEMQLQSEWIAGELGENIPLHLSRYFPMFKRNDPLTPQDTLNRLFEIAASKLDNVYIGNTNSDIGQDTYCPECGKKVTIRSGYTTTFSNLDREGKCTSCGTQVYKYFTFSPKSER
ncbi:MAG: AmmeMemoRadiSam system radical SAM enzyme [Bacteroidales bacterium]|nr:AmmeMemoRadiSam system radical SAM enzyme [Bacteroidales bacterium]